MDNLINYSYIVKVEVIGELPGNLYKKPSYRCKFTNNFVFKGSKAIVRNNEGKVFSCSKQMIVFCDENTKDNLKGMFSKLVRYTNIVIKDNEKFIEDYSNKIVACKEANESYKKDLFFIEEMIKNFENQND